MASASPTAMTMWEDLSEPTPPSPLRLTSAPPCTGASGWPHALLSVLATPHAAQKPPLRAPRLADAIARRAGAACLTLLLRRMALPVSALLW